MQGGKREAEIAGAGLAGLAVAAALAQRGWSVRVHERSPELREIGAGIYLFENALKALRRLGVYDKIAASGVASTMPRALLDHKHRELNMRRGSGPIPELIVILRTELHRILVECAVQKGVDIRTNSPVIGADPQGRLAFKDGSYGPKVDLVVGADGVFSKVRDSLRLATEVVELKDGCGRHLIPRRAGDSLNTQRIEMWSGGRRLGMAPASKDFHYVFLCCPADDTAGRSQQPLNLDAWLTSHPWYREYLERLPRNPEEFWRPFFNVTCSAWSAGRVCIVGDAAHGMAPNLGQGACVAIVNALVLARAVSETSDVEQALRQWEADERPYIARTQRMSYLYGAVGTQWPKSLLGLRTRFLPWFARTQWVQQNLRVALDHQAVF